MKRASAGLLTLLLAACTAAPSEPWTAPPATPAPSTSAAPSASVPPSQSPTPTASPGSTAVQLPDGLDDVAWATIRVIDDANAQPQASILTAGRLGSTASLTETIPWSTGFVNAYPAGGLIAIMTQTADHATIETRRVSDGQQVGFVTVPGRVDQVALDAPHGRLYVAVALSTGGVEIARMGVADGSMTRLVALDRRFTPTGIPTERYGLAITATGTVVVIACAKADGCRVWQVPPGSESAIRPMTLKAGTPIVCSVVTATATSLIVYDDETCGGDTTTSPTPLRAISLRDGSSRLLTRGPIFAAGRLLQVAGRSEVIASTRSPDWSTTDVISIDVATGAQRTLAAGLANPTDSLSGWLGVSAQNLPSDWVLIVPFAVDAVQRVAPPNARLLDVATGRLIELPPGTFGLD